MRIENLRSETSGGKARVAASVIWEDCDRPTQEIYFETDKNFADSLYCNPHAFLVGCIIPAQYHRENRIHLDSEICPELINGVTTALNWIRHWEGETDQELIKIEVKKPRSFLPRARQPRAALFLSGGIDSLACLRANRLSYPLDHPSSFKDALMIYGQNCESDDRPETFALALDALSEVANDAGVTLIPIYTNIRDLDDNPALFKYRFHSAILASVAHALSPRLSSVSIASSADMVNLCPRWGSHPLLDPNYSSTELRIRHDNIEISRFDKTKLIADWDLGLRNIRVCGANWPGMNCGNCEKCIRTMLALVALGVLDRAPLFPRIAITEQFLASNLRLPDLDIATYYAELLSPLAQAGRHDLVCVIQRKLADFKHSQKRINWRRVSKRIDQRYLKGFLGAGKRLVSQIVGIDEN